MGEWQLLWTGRCRLYYNAKEDAPYVWSVDDGDIQNEYKVRGAVMILPGFCTQRRREDMPHQPTVWLEHVSCAVYMNEQREVKITFK